MSSRASPERPVAGATMWITGLPAAGKTTLAEAISETLQARGDVVVRLDGDALRQGLNNDLGFSREDRRESARRVACVALAVASAGAVAVVSMVSPYEEDRAAARRLHAASGLGFIEVHVATSLEVCEQRDPKGLYARARRGDLPDFTGVSARFERPRRPEVRITLVDSPAVSASIAALEAAR